MSDTPRSPQKGETVGPKRYVVGFMVNADRTLVVLIEKRRPDWQSGLLNGVGGKVEVGESDTYAMAREFFEETGCLTNEEWWEPICTVSWENDERVDAEPSIVTFFRYDTRDRYLPPVRSLTDEEVVVERIADIDHLDVIPNLRWLVPLAAYTADRYRPFKVVATVEEVVGG